MLLQVGHNNQVHQYDDPSEYSHRLMRIKKIVRPSINAELTFYNLQMSILCYFWISFKMLSITNHQAVESSSVNRLKDGKYSSSIYPASIHRRQISHSVDSNFQTNFFLIIPGMNLYIYVVTNTAVNINLKTNYAVFSNYRFVIPPKKSKTDR